MVEDYEKKEVLQRLYTFQGLPVTEIAEQLNTTRYIIQARVEEFDLFREYDKPRILYHLYIEKGMSSKEIGEKYNRHHKTILDRLHKFDIPVVKPSRDNPPCLFEKEDGYKMWVTHDGERIQYLYVHRLLAVAKYGYKQVIDKDVHHKNNHAWDNRYQNIELKSKEEHGRLHGKN